MQPIALARQALDACRPIVALVALAAGAVAAWKFGTEMLPVLGQVWAPRVDAQRAAIIAGALSLVAGGR